MMYQILIIILPIITTPDLARTLGSEGIGTFGYTSSIITYFIQKLLVFMNIEFLQTIAFILVIASIVQFVEMVIQKMSPSLYQA